MRAIASNTHIKGPVEMAHVLYQIRNMHRMKRKTFRYQTERVSKSVCNPESCSDWTELPARNRDSLFGKVYL